MIKFIKNLLGFGAKETVKEILTPPSDKVLITRVAVPESNINLSAAKKPQPGKKVKAISVPITEGKVRTNVKKIKTSNKKPSPPPAPKAKK